MARPSSFQRMKANRWTNDEFGHIAPTRNPTKGFKSASTIDSPAAPRVDYPRSSTTSVDERTTSSFFARPSDVSHSAPATPVSRSNSEAEPRLQKTRGRESFTSIAEEVSSIDTHNKDRQQEAATPADETAASRSSNAYCQLSAEDLVAALGRCEEASSAAAAALEVARRGQSSAEQLVNAGALEALTPLLRDRDTSTVEHAAASVLGIARGAPESCSIAASQDPALIDSLIHVLAEGPRGARPDAAATLGCLASSQPARANLMERGALGPLIALVRDGEMAAKKDALLCLLSIAVSKECRAPIARAGIVPILCQVLGSSAYVVDEEAAGILAALSRDPEGRACLHKQDAIPSLAELVECGSTVRSKEYAVTALLELAMRDRACLEAIYEEGVSEAVKQLRSSESQKTSLKARALMKLLAEIKAQEREGDDDDGSD